MTRGLVRKSVLWHARIDSRCAPEFVAGRMGQPPAGFRNSQAQAALDKDGKSNGKKMVFGQCPVEL